MTKQLPSHLLTQPHNHSATLRTLSVLLPFVLIAIFSTQAGAGEWHDPLGIHRWSQQRTNREWAALAEKGIAEAQYHEGVALLDGHLDIVIDRLPGFAAIPFLGRWLFTRTFYGISHGIQENKRAEAHLWIKKSADQGFSPAKLALKLFVGRDGSSK